MTPTRSLNVPFVPASVSAAPRRSARPVPIRARFRRLRSRLAILEVDLADLRLDDATVHADLVDLFERRTG